MRVAGGNHKTIQQAAARWGIATDHFDANAVRARATRGRRLPLEAILVKGSTYHRATLKQRLYEAGLKQPACEICGQGEIWRGNRISLILDHVNGDATDHRLENLRIACPNCAAAFPTHCGRNKNLIPDSRTCEWCREEFRPKYGQQRFCSISCAKRKHEYEPRHESRRTERPPYEQLMREIEETNYSAVGRKYGVSDNAVRKWVRWYERERRQAARRWRIGVLTRLAPAVYANSRRRCVLDEGEATCEEEGR
jgi:transposase-like protein